MGHALFTARRLTDETTEYRSRTTGKRYLMLVDDEGGIVVSCSNELLIFLSGKTSRADAMRLVELYDQTG